MPEIAVFTEVDPIRPPTNPEEFWPDVRSCDACGESVTADLMNGMNWDTCRRFWRDSRDGCVLCDHCFDPRATP
jgi:hypothetical protein